MRGALGSGSGQRQRSPGEYDRKPTVPYPGSSRDTKAQLERRSRPSEPAAQCQETPALHPTATGKAREGESPDSHHACSTVTLCRPGVQFQVIDDEELPRKVHTQSLICKLDNLDDYIWGFLAEIWGHSEHELILIMSQEFGEP